MKALGRLPQKFTHLKSSPSEVLIFPIGSFNFIKLSKHWFLPEVKKGKTVLLKFTIPLCNLHKKDTVLHVLIWNYLQNKLLSEKKQGSATCAYWIMKVVSREGNWGEGGGLWEEGVWFFILLFCTFCFLSCEYIIDSKTNQ